MKRTLQLALHLGMSFALAATVVRADGVTFRTVKAEETGIKAIVEKWRADELASHGGKKPSHWWWPWGLTAFDYDRDGDIDLLPTHHGGAHGILLRNLLAETGKLTFVEATKEVGLERHDLPTAIGKRTWTWDFDGDGWLDIIGIRSPNLLNQGGKKFVKAGKSPFDNFHPREIIDVNDDGYPDITTTGGGTWLFVPESKTFRRTDAETPAILANIPEELKAALAEKKKLKRNRFFRIHYLTDYDLNADGINDVIIRGEGSYGAEILGRYLIADGDGKLTDRTRELRLPEEGAPIMVKDLTGDGRLEVLVAVGKQAGLYLSDGKGHFSVKDGELKKFLERGGPYLLRAWTADFDNDGDEDLVVSNPRYGNEQVYENRGEGNFTKVLQAGGWDSAPVCIVDMNGDGLIDLAIGGPGHHDSTEITLYLNETPNPGNYCNIHLRMDAPNPYAIGALVEVYAAGELGKPGARPFLAENAHHDATAVHVGLGRAEAFDLRVTFPGKPPVELRNVAAKKRLQIAPDGQPEEPD